MRRALVVVLVAITALAVAGVVLLVRPTDAAPVPRSSSSPSVLESAALPPVAEPEPAPQLPAPRFSRTMHAATTMPASDPLIDDCAGPVAIDLGDTHPLLVAEHDYCGGSAWMPRLEPGDTVELDGPGVEPGLYVVTDIALGQRRQARMSDLPDAAVVLQTCISETQITMVGLDPADEVVAL